MKWFNKEFYEHLWNISDKYGSNWFELVPDDDPDLQYCRRIVKEKDAQSEAEKRNDFLFEIQEVFDSTRIKKIYDLARALELNYKEFLYRIRKFDIELDVKHVLVLRNGYVLVRDGAVELISANKSNIYRFVNAQVRKVNQAIDSGELIDGCKVYSYEKWFEQSGYEKDIKLTRNQRKELVNARVTKISTRRVYSKA